MFRASQNYSCHLYADGTVDCWGYPPRDVQELTDANFSDIELMYNAICGISAGVVRCLGEVTVLPFGNERVRTFDAGNNDVCAVMLDGHIRCQSGVDPSLIPAGNDWELVAVSDYGLFCAMHEVPGTPTCWNTVGVEDPVVPPGDYVKLDGGNAAMCGLRTDGTVACWYLWDSDYEGITYTPPGDDFVDITVGIDHACALRASGQAVCWGETIYPEDLDYSPVPDQPWAEFDFLSAGSYFTCGHKVSGGVACWGYGTTPGATCGDGIVQPASEACDDGNYENGDGCSSDCQSREECGNGIVDVSEVCDDNENFLANLCSDDCQSIQMVPDGLCADILAVSPEAPDGIYDLSLGGGTDTVPAYCDMTGGGWTLVFKKSPGVSRPPETLWASTATNEGDLNLLDLDLDLYDYSSRLTNMVGVWSEAKVAIADGGVIAQELVFDATDIGGLDWFNPDQLVSSSWTTLPTDGFDFGSGPWFEFSHQSTGYKYFFIANSAPSEGPEHWMMMMPYGGAYTYPYSYDFTPYQVFYSPADGWSTPATHAEADALMIFVK